MPAYSVLQGSVPPKIATARSEPIQDLAAISWHSFSRRRAPFWCVFCWLPQWGIAKDPWVCGRYSPSAFVRRKEAQKEIKADFSQLKYAAFQFPRLCLTEKGELQSFVPKLPTRASKQRPCEKQTQDFVSKKTERLFQTKPSSLGVSNYQHTLRALSSGDSHCTTAVLIHVTRKKFNMNLGRFFGSKEDMLTPRTAPISNKHHSNQKYCL